MNTYAKRVRHALNGRRQQGISLLIVLILLVVTSILGIAVMRSSAMQERMSANMRDRSIAMQATEAALRYAQTRLAAPIVGRPVDQTWDDLDTIPTTAECASMGICPAGTLGGTWMSVPGSEYDSSTLPTAPEYWIEYLGIAAGSVGAGEDTRSEAGPDTQSPMFRITARSRATGRAEVVLQANVMSRIPNPGT